MGDNEYFKIIENIKNELNSVIIDKVEAINKLLACLFAEGHLLIEDMPGVGKTTMALAVSKLINCTFSRIQFTADLLPSDVIGTSIYHRKTEEFEFIKGPVFANLVLADELNRAPPKTQSALLQAMSDKVINIENRAIPLPVPFMVIATQNPRGFYGTYPLPESQRDRFLMRLSLGYPGENAEMEILKRHKFEIPVNKLSAVASKKHIIEICNRVKKVTVNDNILAYITRAGQIIINNNEVAIPVSPRGSIALMRAAQALSYVKYKDFVDIDTVKELIPNVFCHRISLINKRISKEGANERWIKTEILQKIPIG